MYSTKEELVLTYLSKYLPDFYFSTGKMAACKPNYYSPPPEFQTSRHPCVKLNFLDRPEIVELPLVDSCEELWRLGARKIVGVKPPALEIFGIKSTKSSIWLSPSDPIPLDQENLEFRLRFKPPHPGRLKEIDKSAFRYYYAQVRNDLYRGILLKNIAKGQLISIGILGVFKSTKKKVFVRIPALASKKKLIQKK